MNTPKSSANTQNSSKSLKSLKNMTLGATLAAALVMGAPGCKQWAKNEKQTPQTEQTTESKDLIAHTAGNSSTNTKDPSAWMDASNPADMMNNSAEGEEWSEEDFGKLMEVVDVEIENEYLEEENKKLDEQNKKLDERIFKNQREIEDRINSLSVEELLAVDGIETAVKTYMDICKDLNKTPNPKMVTVQKKLLANR